MLRWRREYRPPATYWSSNVGRRWLSGRLAQYEDDNIVTVMGQIKTKAKSNRCVSCTKYTQLARKPAPAVVACTLCACFAARHERKKIRNRNVCSRRFALTALHPLEMWINIGAQLIRAGNSFFRHGKAAIKTGMKGYIKNEQSIWRKLAPGFEYSLHRNEYAIIGGTCRVPPSSMELYIDGTNTSPAREN